MHNTHSTNLNIPTKILHITMSLLYLVSQNTANRKIKCPPTFKSRDVYRAYGKIARCLRWGYRQLRATHIGSGAGITRLYSTAPQKSLTHSSAPLLPLPPASKEIGLSSPLLNCRSQLFGVVSRAKSSPLKPYSSRGSSNSVMDI